MMSTRASDRATQERGFQLVDEEDGDFFSPVRESGHRRRTECAVSSPTEESQPMAVESGPAQAAGSPADEFAGVPLRLLLVRLILGALPVQVGGRLRAQGLRWAGFRVGRGTIMAGLPVVTGGRNVNGMLRIGSGCRLNAGCVFDVGAPISIGDQVSFGHAVAVLTGTHEIGTASQRAGRRCTKAVSIGDGAWLGARCTIFPGVQIGHGAVVGAGAVVTSDVPANVMVAGVPAQFIRALP